jgi:hypothetical protein
MRRHRPHRLSGLLVLSALLLAGCGSSASPSSKGHTNPKKTTPAHTTTTPKLSAAATRKRALIAKVDVTSDRILAEGKVHIAAGAPSDSEVRKEIEAAKKSGIKLPAGESVAAFEAAEAQSEGPAAGAETPLTPWNPRSKPIAAWIIPVLAWASEHGWKGTVTSGYRSYYEQAQLNAAGDFSAPAGFSNHETTAYPGGAVDVTASSQLIAVLRSYPGPRKLVGGVLGAVDPEHFSATGD